MKWWVVAAAAIAVIASLTVPPAHADDLDDKKDRINKELKQTEREIDESSKQVSQKTAALESARGQLAAAKAELARTREELAAAKQRDAEMAQQLKRAKADLAEAKKAVQKGIARLEAQREKVGAVVQAQWQQKTNLLPVAVLAQAGSTRDFQTRLQWSTTMFDASEAKIKELEATQRQLNADRQKLSGIEKETAEQRAAAAENLKRMQRLEAQAEQQRANVAALVQQAAQAKDEAESALAAEKSEYAKLEKEKAAVEKRIKERIEAQKKAEAERKKREAEERKKREAEKRATRNSNRTTGGSGGSSSSSAHHGFVYPVNGPITSPYGMRKHPVTGVWKLHDGTDFGVGCGTPIRAAYSGTVTERYWNVAWGNRLMIDHGKVDGYYVSTAYNHATHYVVSVGQQVSTGQVIGYVGTTGWSTGCHLHLNLYLNGSVSNPMSWY